MQNEFDQDHADLGIQIIGINEIKQEHGNEGMTAGRDLPWLQDVDLNGNNQDDITVDLWNVEYRDVVILDAEGEWAGVYNLTVNDLGAPVNYDALKQMILEAAVVEEDTTPWQNEVDAHDVNGDGLVTPIDALLIINLLISDGAHELSSTKDVDSPFFDSSGDNFVSPIDALMVINRLNAPDDTAEGEPVDSLFDAANVEARRFEDRPSAIRRVETKSIDLAFASYLDADDASPGDDEESHFSRLV